MPDKSDIAQLIGSITTDARQIVQGEMALAREQLKPTLGKLKLDGLVLGLALVAATAFGLLFLVFLGLALSWGFSCWTGWSSWACAVAGFGIVAFVFLVVMAIAAVAGLKRLSVNLKEASDTVKTVSTDTAEAFGALQQGLAQGQALVDRSSH
jgi:hypothetical protein